MKENLQKGTVILLRGRISPSIHVLWPLIAWLCLVLVLYGIRLHQRWIEKTRLNFSVALEGRNVDYDAVAKLDGEPISSGQQISLGWHTMTITHAKGIGFSTNLTTWYGGHNLGTIILARAKGTLQLSLNRPAKSVVIRGPEWRLELTNSAGGVWVVPTDTYEVDARFAYLTRRERANVAADSTSTIHIAPPFGAAHITSSHPDTRFRLSAKKNYIDLNGSLPITVDELPAGEYELKAERLGEEKPESVFVTADRTNEVVVAFSYGALTFDTVPEGAMVYDSSGQERGRTPITCSELRPGTWHFKLERDGYQPVTTQIRVNPNETNYFQTNLVSHQYVTAIEQSQRYFSAGEYDDAAKAADEALEYKAGDLVATALRREATGNSHLARAKAFAERNDYSAAIEELKSAAEFIPKNGQIEDLLASYTEKQKNILELEAERKAKQRTIEQREAQISGLKTKLNSECSRYGGYEAFTVHELFSTKNIKDTAQPIGRAMAFNPPTFETVRYEWKEQDLVMDFRQKVFDGSRQCVIVGGQVSTNEWLICFRVIEIQTPHSFSWAGGLITAQLTTEGDRSGERAARFEQQVKDGAKMVEDRIRRAIGMR